jgi:ATP/maltotriose-dependent transcriptional regulator MalT/class 3 adenylate cyclase
MDGAQTFLLERSERPVSVEGLIVVLFTDLVGSTELLERLGEDEAESVRRSHFGAMRTALDDHGGREVKTLGDGVMAVFRSALGAIGCARAMQATAPEGLGGLAALKIRVGLHAGEPIQHESDYFGTTVVLARRLCDAAAPGQILASDLVFGLAGTRSGLSFTPIGKLSLKGFSEPVAAYDVDWRGSRSGALRDLDRPTAAAPGRPTLLRTRLVPPSLPRSCLPRPELVGLVVDGLQGRLVSIVAGAGYGKTTLLTQALEACPFIWIWLSCDERMASPEALLGHLAAGLGERFPGVATRLELEGSVEAQADELCNEVALTVADDVVIAVDDVHALGATAQGALGLLVRHMPPEIHLGLASRAALPFRLPRQRGRVLHVGERALALTPEECAELVGLTDDGPLPAAVERLHGASEGWVTGVLLGATSGAEGGLGPGSDGEGIFGYLADEVLEGESPAMRDFLLTTSVLDRFTPELAAAVSGESNARESIGTLISRHLFTVRLDAGGEWYRYHHLFAEFLRQRLREAPDLRQEEIHERAAEAWLAAGERGEAARHFLAAGAPERAAAALEGVAESMATTPEAGVLADWLDAIPSDVRDGRPGLALAHASLVFGAGDYDGAVREHVRAVDLLLEAGDRRRAALALARLLQVLTGIGAEAEAAISEAERVLSRLDPDDAMVAAARLLLAGFLAQAGRYEDAEEELTKAAEAPAARRHPSLAVYAEVNRAFFITHPLGQSRAALAALDRAASWLDIHETEDPLTSLVWAQAFRAVTETHLGRWEEALRSAELWRDAWERRGGTRRAGERSSSWVRFGAYAALGRWAELERELAAASATAAAVPGTIYSSRFAAGRALLAAQRGDRETVAEVLETPLVGAAFPRSMLLADLALAARDVGLAGKARALARDALDSAMRVDAPWAAARASIVGAAVSGSGEHADRLIAEALRLSDRPGFEELWTRRERRLAGALIARALAVGLGPPGAAARLALACGADAAADVGDALGRVPAEVRAQLAAGLAEAPAADPGLVRRLLADRDETVKAAAVQARRRAGEGTRVPLRIAALGGFSVARGGAPVPALSSGRSRARTLLAALVAADRPVHREQLVDWFWSHLPPRRALAALHTTLHTVRRQLDPEGAGRDSRNVISTDGEAYRLALDERDELDVRALRRLAAEARSLPAGDLRMSRLLAAEGLSGEFLPEWPYDDWATSGRAEVERTREWVLATLAEDLEAGGEPLAAASRYSRLLEADPEREAWHRALMRAYAAAGERARALRQFHACRTVLRERLGSEPGAETRALYASLL